jgi:hypothetical protein
MCKTGENTSTDHGIIFKYNAASISNRKMRCSLLVLIYEYSWYISSRWISFIRERSRNIYPTKPICKVICKLGRCTRYHIMWSSLSVACDRSVGFLRVLTCIVWPYPSCSNVLPFSLILIIMCRNHRVRPRMADYYDIRVEWVSAWELVV